MTGKKGAVLGRGEMGLGHVIGCSPISRPFKWGSEIGLGKVGWREKWEWFAIRDLRLEGKGVRKRDAETQ